MLRIAKIRQGFNPNSSSLSVNMALLFAATGLFTFGTFVVAAAVRLFRKKKSAPPNPPETS
jgi:hypothetical protein